MKNRNIMNGESNKIKFSEVIRQEKNEQTEEKKDYWIVTIRMLTNTAIVNTN